VGKFAASIERLKTKSASASGWLRPPDPWPATWGHWSSCSIARQH